MNDEQPNAFLEICGSSVRVRREFQRHAELRLVGKVEGAHRWAVLLGVVRTAPKHSRDLQAYLRLSTTYHLKTPNSHLRQA